MVKVADTLEGVKCAGPLNAAPKRTLSAVDMGIVREVYADDFDAFQYRK